MEAASGRLAHTREGLLLAVAAVLCCSSLLADTSIAVLWRVASRYHWVDMIFSTMRASPTCAR